MRSIHTGRSEVYNYSNSYGIFEALNRISKNEVAGKPNPGSGLKNLNWSPPYYFFHRLTKHLQNRFLLAANTHKYLWI